jgi:hypothetical protein
MALPITTDTRTFRLGAFGVSVVVRAHGAGAEQLERAALRAWSRCLVAPDPEAPDACRDLDEPQIDLCVGDCSSVLPGAPGTGWITAPDVTTAMDRLTSAVTVALMTRRAGSLLMLHACGLTDPSTGATVALVAPSGTGKTTLARTLGTAWGYVSDETVAVQADGAVLPYPKPLSCVISEDVEAKEQIGPDECGLLSSGDRDLYVAAVLLLERRPDAPRTPRLDVVPTVHALAALAPETSYFTRLERPLGTLADILNSTGGLRRVTYREASDLSGTVSALLSDRRVGRAR